MRDIPQKKKKGDDTSENTGTKKRKD